MDVTFSVTPFMIGAEAGFDADFTGETVNELAFRLLGYPPKSEVDPKWLREFLDALNDEARSLIKHFAAAIEAEEKSEGGA